MGFGKGATFPFGGVLLKSRGVALCSGFVSLQPQNPTIALNTHSLCRYSVRLLSPCLVLMLALWSLSAAAQFPGPAGSSGSTAMHKDSTAFVAWAAFCSVEVGYMDIGDTSLGKVFIGDPGNVPGPADGTSIISLGDGGQAIVSFNPTIGDGPGFDFAVFENSFSDNFLELAFVEVSSDGVNFFRFPATSNLPTDTQFGPFDDISDASKIDNLAGKYRAGFGTPFDLQQLAGTPGLDITAITHVRVLDVIGSLDPNFATYDQFGTAINDPYPTGFPSGGFDLEAIGVIHTGPVGLNESPFSQQVVVYPNPVESGSIIKVEGTQISYALTLIDLQGKTVATSEGHQLETSGISPGIYLLQIAAENHLQVRKVSVF